MVICLIPFSHGLLHFFSALHLCIIYIREFLSTCFHPFPISALSLFVLFHLLHSSMIYLSTFWSHLEILLLLPFVLVSFHFSPHPPPHPNTRAAEVLTFFIKVIVRGGSRLGVKVQVGMNLFILFLFHPPFPPPSLRPSPYTPLPPPFPTWELYWEVWLRRFCWSVCASAYMRPW